MKDRNLIEIIDKMLSIIPDEEENLRTSLIDIQDSQRFRAPENMIGWYQIKEFLDNFEWNLKTPEWKLQMCSIFTTQPVENIKKDIYEYIKTRKNP